MSHAAEFDSHGHKDHGHVIVSTLTLRLVLAALICLTIATVGAAYIEEFFAYTFGIIFPQWVNVIVAMSIAVVKTTIVVLFFMQLKYDNPLNAMIFIFTIMCVAFFLMFTMIDLGNRSSIARYKGQEIVVGGTGLAGTGPLAEAILDETLATNPSLVHHHHEERLHSSAHHSRPVEGVTLEAFMDAGFDDGGHDDQGHGGGH